ncbi:hypothetical protein AGABI2DRAFT_135709 [Agaricus bisporus var. bisporus H97]|uniref:hypothetical protein n=1 Tax=Agaricus bisporus var. bisporus (strain H97 / ATCC MYA-4626 / FGSC 10389) TaxID=936046 RepID=UPI00029F59BD|nr:hypothetical protein AGABI2DRAFT_135709 [Agaricus bisporus var. bisporus H97]EKV48686.1 hypothetical protein AGABI2DRAFT_135709 [Agaricus bisporus var. bisporus H97]
MFLFDPGQGACGFTNTSTQIVASVSRQIFTTYPNATKNPNKNPICKHQVSIFYGGKTLAAPIVDFFTDPNAQLNVGLSLPGFEQFASRDDGIVEGVRWTIV